MISKIKLFTRTFFAICIVFSASIAKSQNIDTEIARQIDSIRITHNVPSIAYGIIRNDSIIVINTVGYRDILTKERAQSEDLYHIGSNTKSFTGFLAAKMVEDNLIKWDTKFFDLYPELKNESNTTYYDITLRELLSHRARLINFDERGEIELILTKYKKTIDNSFSLPEKRYFLVKEVLKSEPLPPYEECKRSYSNVGFIAAALMLEKVSGQTWEKLMVKVSNDLKLGVHIGTPSELGLHQPKGHVNPMFINSNIDKDLIPVHDGQRELPADFYEFLQLCTPAGNISISVNDFLKFLQLNISGINGENNYLKAESYKQIFNTYPFYSMGWFNEPKDKLRYSHRGSSILFNSFAGISPENKLGIVIMINTYNDTAITEVFNLLWKNYAKK